MFDALPNELFYEVFEYLTAYEILYAFNGLNRRMNTLLKKYDRYDLHFQSWPKSKFDFVCQSISSELVRSLILSDPDDTCREIHKFFGLFYIRQFVNLESLTLIKIAEQDLNKLATKFHSCSKLSSLTIRLAQGFIPKIILPPSLKHLSIGICSMSQLHELLLCTPSLINLNVQLVADSTPVDNIFLLPTEIRELKIELPEKSNIEFDNIKVLFQWMPKLQTLTFTATKGFKFIHGAQWEHIFRTYLPRLKKFHFKIRPNLADTNIDQLLATFQTPFWLNEKQWFIHCDHYHLPNAGYRDIRNVHLYTLPYSDEQFHLTSSTLTERKAPKAAYFTIKNLYFSIDCHYDTKIAQRYYFPHLHSLTIRNLHKLISMNSLIDLSQVKHLTIEQNNLINAEEFFSYVLVHAVNLQSLTLSWHILVGITKNFTDQRVCSLLKKQITNLNLLNMMSTNNEDNGKPIEMLNRIFSKNLEKLSFNVTSIDNILLVLNNMFKLYSLKVECDSCHTTMNNKELLSWLMRNVPRLENFTHQIQPRTETRVCLLLWISC